jgi:hypothetical protein
MRAPRFVFSKHGIIPQVKQYLSHTAQSPQCRRSVTSRNLQGIVTDGSSHCDPALKFSVWRVFIPSLAPQPTHVVLQNNQEGHLHALANKLWSDIRTCAHDRERKRQRHRRR